MVKLYFLFDGTGGVPEGYTDETSWNNRYIYFSQNYAYHGTTGGADNHTHSVSNVSLQAAGTYRLYNYTGSDWYEYSYTPTHASHTCSVGTPSSTANLPLYYALKLISIDLNVWETYYKYFPIGAILPSVSELNHMEMSRFTSADGRLIRLGQPGLVGGDSTHFHNISVSANYVNPNNNAIGRGYSGNTPVSHTYESSLWHNHSAVTRSSNNASSFPAYVKTRLYRINMFRSRASEGVVCFVDGLPSENWTLLNGWDGRFLMSYDTDAYLEGSHTHSHQLSTYTSEKAWGTSTHGSGGGTATCINQSHSHPITATLDSSDLKPQYVTLIPVKLNKTLYHSVPGVSTINAI